MDKKLRDLEQEIGRHKEDRTASQSNQNSDNSWATLQGSVNPIPLGLIRETLKLKVYKVENYKLKVLEKW